MEVYIFWGSIGILTLFSLVGFLTGLIRGLKRAGLHIIFYLAAIVLAFLLSGVIAGAVLKITINIGGTAYSLGGYIKKVISEMVDVSTIPTAAEFIEKVPYAIVTPIVFLACTSIFSGLFGIIYLIVARVSFGKKKEDLKKHKAFRAYGALVGLCESLFMMFILFAPITALTQTFEQIAIASEESSSSATATGDHMQKFSEMVDGIVPEEATGAIVAFNKGVVGKLTSVGGFNNFVFDTLSSFDFQGEKIVFRKEAANLVDCYDTVVEIYNAYVDDALEDVNTNNLKKRVDSLLNSGLFKTVVSNTIRDVVVNYETIKASLGLNPPEIVENIILDIKTKFSASGFDPYQYLKHDFSALANAAETIFKNNVVKAFKDNTDTSLTGILSVVSSKNEQIKIILDEALGLNIIKDSINQFTGFVDEKLRAVFSDKDTEENLKKKIGINVTSSTDIDQLMDDVVEAIDGLLEINASVNVADILSSGNILESIKTISNVDTILIKMGQTFDKFKNLSALTLPVDTSIGRTEEQKVFDNMLGYYNISLLGDSVYYKDGSTYSTTATNLDTYEKFFTHMSIPAKTAQSLGLLGDTINIDTILTAVKNSGNSIITNMLIPFYQLDIASFNGTDSVKEFVFDNIVDMIETNIDILDVTAVKTEVNIATGKRNKVIVWTRELDYLGQILNVLNQGDIGPEHKSYIKYVLDGSPNLEELIRAMADSDDLDEVFTPVFEATICSEIKSMVLDGLDTLIETVDNGVESITGVNPHSPQTDATFTKEKTVATINTLLELEIDDSIDYTKLANLGALLNSLRTNAYNGGTKDGVFKEVFANLIWYMTGDDDLVATANQGYYVGKTPNEHHSEIEAILKVSNSDEYYTFDYEAKFAEIDNAVALAETIAEALEGENLGADPQAFIDAFVDAINGEKGTTPEDEAELIEIIENLDTLIEEAGQDAILSESDRTNYGSMIHDAIENEDSFSDGLKTAIYDLLGI